MLIGRGRENSARQVRPDRALKPTSHGATSQVAPCDVGLDMSDRFQACTSYFPKGKYLSKAFRKRTVIFVRRRTFLDSRLP